MSSPVGSAGGRAPAGNAFWRILKATKRFFLYLHADASGDLVLEFLKHDKS